MVAHRALGVLDRLDRVLPWALATFTGALLVSWAGRVGSTSDRVWATALIAMALAEYVNYFRVQLSLALVGRRRRPTRPADLSSSMAATHGAGGTP